MSTTERMRMFLALSPEQQRRALLWLAANYGDVLDEAIEQASGDG